MAIDQLEGRMTLGCTARLAHQAPHRQAVTISIKACPL
jgi:hypothetical protein